MPYPVLKGPLKGTRFILGTLAGEGGGASVYFGKVEPEQTRALLNELKPGQTFFDIGANVGYYTLLASRAVGNKGAVIACEPVLENLVSLQRHLQLNNARNVHVLAFACSDSDSTAFFLRGPNSAMGHFASENTYDRNAVLVPTITLDRIVDLTGLKPDAIKIDVEGAELKVLQGAARLLADAGPTIFLSTHSPELRRSCLGLLQQFGYTVRPLDQSKDPHEFVAKNSS